MISTQPDSQPQRTRSINYAFWILTILVVLPAWLLEFLPLVDLPLHIARADILYRYAADPFLQRTYDLVIEPIPNIGMDMLMMGLMRIFPAGVAVKLLLTLIIVLFSTGIRAIVRTFGSNAAWLEFLAPLLTYHTMFVYGFTNYVLGLGLFFWTFSIWYRMSERSDQWLGRWLFLALLATISYFTHLSSYAFLVVAIGTALLYELATRSPFFVSRLKIATAAMVPLVFFLLFMRGSGTNSGVAFSDIRGKFTTLLMLVTSYDKRFDLFLLVLLISVVAVAFFASKKRHLVKPAVALAVVFAIAFVLCPATLFTSTLADARLVPVFYVFLLCAIRFELSPTLARVLVACVLVLFGVRSLLISTEWLSLSSEMRRLLHIADVLPAHARVRPLYYHEDVVLNKEYRPFRHVLSYKMVDHDLVLASYIGLPGQQPVVFKQQPVPVLLERSSPVTNAALDSLELGYDYLWAYRLSATDDAVLSARYVNVIRDKDVAIYKTR